jgi:hypothetical protein
MTGITLMHVTADRAARPSADAAGAGARGRALVRALRPRAARRLLERGMRGQEDRPREGRR